MSTRPLGAPDPTSGTGALQRTQRAATQPLTPPQPVEPQPRAVVDANLARGRLLHPGSPSGGPEILAKQEELAAKRLELAKREMELRAQQPTSLFARFTSSLSELWAKAKNEVSGLRDEVAKLEHEVANFASQAVHEVADTVSSATSAAVEKVKEVGHEVYHVAESVVDAADKTADAVAHGAREAYRSYDRGEGVMTALETGIETTGADVAKAVINPLLDRSALGGADEFEDAGEGLGALLTNRLAIGESASIKIEAGATLPTEALGLPNAKLDAGGTLEIRRVQKTDEQGHLITEPKDAKGNPPSELKVTLSLEGRAGGAYSAEVGVQAGFTAGDKTVGVNASLRAEAEAGAAGKVSYTFAFDPSKQQDMQTLTGMVKATAETGAVGMIPGLGAVLGTVEAARHAEDFKSFGRHLESFTGEGGLYAQANASASADLGIFGANDVNEKTGKRDKAYTEVGEEETLADQMLLNVGALEAGLGGDARVGAKTNYRTGDQTYYVKVGGQVNASAEALGVAGGEAGLEANRKLAVTYDREGNLKSVRIEQEVTKERFEGLRNTVEDIYGRPLSEGFIAQVGESDTMRISYELKPEHRERLAGMLQGSMTDRAKAMKELAGLTISPDNVRLQKGDLVAVHHDTFELGGAFAVKLGAVAGVRAKLTLDRGQETAVD